MRSRVTSRPIFSGKNPTDTVGQARSMTVPLMLSDATRRVEHGICKRCFDRAFLFRV